MKPTTWFATMDAITAAFQEAHPLSTEIVHLGERSLKVAVARTPEQWARGLTGRSDIEAMLFVMPPGSRFPFHMRNVDRDLAIAFFDEAGNMVDYAFLEAQVGIKWPSAPYAYVLEFAVRDDDLTIFEDVVHGLRF